MTIFKVKIEPNFVNILIKFLFFSLKFADFINEGKISFLWALCILFPCRSWLLPAFFHILAQPDILL